MNWSNIWPAGAAIAAVGTLILFLWQQFRAVRQQNAEQLAKQEEQRARDEEFKLDWNGAAARPGVPAQPGVMARLEKIEHNTSSLPERVSALEGRMSKTEGVLDAHVAGHLPPV